MATIFMKEDNFFKDKIEKILGIDLGERNAGDKDVLWMLIEKAWEVKSGIYFNIKEQKITLEYSSGGVNNISIAHLENVPGIIIAEFLVNAIEDKLNHGS